MKNSSVCYLKPAITLSILFILILPAAAFCTSWEPIGPAGGNFIFSVTNPMNANEVTAITTNPSPSYVYRSTDAGANWNKIGEIPSPYIYDVSAFDFSNLYAITSSYCYRSTDGGESWTVASLPSSAGWAYRVCADPTDSSKVYAAGYISDYQNNTFTYNMVFFKSTDGGMNWSTSSFFTFDSFYPYDMAISKSNPNVMYISGRKRVGSDSSGALLTTSDGGNTWTDISSSVDTESSYFDSVAIDPTDEERVYVGGSYLYRSVEAGRGLTVSWQRSSTRLYPYSIKVDPAQPSRIYAAGYQSVSVSTDYGQTWTTHYDCVRNSSNHIEVAPADPAKIYVSTYAGFFKSVNSGSTWNPAHGGINAARINVLAVDPSKVIVQNSGYLMAYKIVRAAIWQDVVTPDSCGEVCDILINPENPDTVLILEDYG